MRFTQFGNRRQRTKILDRKGNRAVAFFHPSFEYKGTALKKGRTELRICFRKKHCLKNGSFILEREKFHRLLMGGKHLFGSDEPPDEAYSRTNA